MVEEKIENLCLKDPLEVSRDGTQLYHVIAPAQKTEDENLSYAIVPLPEEGFSFIGVLSTPSNSGIKFQVGKYRMSTLLHSETDQLSYFTPFQSPIMPKVEGNIKVLHPNVEFFILGYKKIIPSETSLLSPGVHIEFIVLDGQKNPAYTNTGSTEIRDQEEGMFYKNY